MDIASSVAVFSDPAWLMHQSFLSRRVQEIFDIRLKHRLLQMLYVTDYTYAS